MMSFFVMIKLGMLRWSKLHRSGKMVQTHPPTYKRQRIMYSRFQTFGPFFKHHEPSSSVKICTSPAEYFQKLSAAWQVQKNFLMENSRVFLSVQHLARLEPTLARNICSNPLHVSVNAKAPAEKPG